MLRKEKKAKFWFFWLMKQRYSGSPFNKLSFLFFSALPNELKEEMKLLTGIAAPAVIDERSEVIWRLEVELDEMEFGLPFLWVGYGRCSANGSAQRRERKQTNSIDSNSTRAEAN